jgi:hypothetical protein
VKFLLERKGLIEISATYPTNQGAKAVSKDFKLYGKPPQILKVKNQVSCASSSIPTLTPRPDNKPLLKIIGALKRAVFFQGYLMFTWCWYI